MKILVAEDDVNLLKGLCEIMEDEGFQTIPANDGAAALELYKEHAPDFLCLDIMMPQKNGYDVCREIRRNNKSIPIIFLSAKAEEIDKVLGLELGADDFISKPFGVREVVARIRAVARRYMQDKEPSSIEDSFNMNMLRVFPLQMKAVREDHEIDLSLREIKILTLLHSRANQVIHRDDLLDECWGAHIMPESRTVDQHVARLRKKIERDPKEPEIIKTVHGAGYRYEE